MIKMKQKKNEKSNELHLFQKISNKLPISKKKEEEKKQILIFPTISHWILILSFLLIKSSIVIIDEIQTF